MALHDTFNALETELLEAGPVVKELEALFKRLRFEPTLVLGLALVRLGCTICLANRVTAAAMVQPIVAGVAIPKGQKVM